MRWIVNKWKFLFPLWSFFIFKNPTWHPPPRKDSRQVAEASNMAHLTLNKAGTNKESHAEDAVLYKQTVKDSKQLLSSHAPDWLEHFFGRLKWLKELKQLILPLARMDTHKKFLTTRKIKGMLSVSDSIMVCFVKYLRLFLGMF